MKFSTSIIILLLSVITLTAEFLLYMFFGFGAALSGSEAALSGTAFFFVGLMILTIVAGIAAPISALVESATKKAKAGIYTYVSIMSLTFMVIIATAVFGGKTKTPSQVASSNSVTSTLTSNATASNASTNPVSKNNTAESTATDSDAEQLAYIDQITVRNVEVSKNILDEDGVFGEIKNTGNRTLKEVEITVYALDKKGNAIFDDKFHPVLDSSLSINDSNKPLKPNYSRKFGYKLDAPSEWSKRVKVEVTRVEFATDVNEQKESVSPSETVAARPISGSSTPAPAQPSFPTRLRSEKSFDGERFSETRIREMSYDEISQMSDDDLRYAINEMYARYGMTFKDKSYQANFEGYKWYSPNDEWTANQVEKEFGSTERANFKLLTAERSARQNAGSE